jgi:hypothetical protein
MLIIRIIGLGKQIEMTDLIDKPNETHPALHALRHSNALSAFAELVVWHCYGYLSFHGNCSFRL